MNVNISNYTECFRCGGNDLVLDYKAGDIICRECGEVINDRVIDEGNEVKFYMNDDDPHKSSRSSGLSETIGSLQTSFVTNSESVKRTLERAQRFSSDKKELQALAHLNNVSEMCSKMNLIAPIKNKAIDIFTQTILGRIVTSKSKDPIAAACVYLACRMENYPRTLDEVSFSTGVDVRTISKMQQAIARKLQLSIGRLRPQHLVNRFAAKLHCLHSIGTLSFGICESITRLELLETQAPQLIAAGSLVVASLLANYALDISELSVVSLVSIPSIKFVYQSMHPLLPAIVSTLDVSRLSSGRRTLQQFPRVLDKLMFEDKLVMDNPDKLVNSVAPQMDFSVGGKSRSSAGAPAVSATVLQVDDPLVELVRDLTDEPLVAARPSANNLTLLLQGKKEQILHNASPQRSTESPTSASALVAVVSDVGEEYSQASTASTERKRSRGASAVACSEEEKFTEVKQVSHSPLQKIQKVVV